MAAVPHFGTGDSTTATAASGTGSALTIAKPANVAVGDLLVGTFYSQFAGTVTTPPSGWTLAHALTTFRDGGVYWLAVTDATVLAGLPSTWSATMSGSGRLCWEIHRVTGANLTTPIDVVGTDVQNANATTVLTSVSPANPGGLLEAIAWWNNSSTTQSNYAPDAAMTDGEQVKSPTTGNTSGIDIAYQQLSSAGATGTRSFVTTPTGASNGGFMFVINAGSASVSADAALTTTATLTASASSGTSGAASLTPTATLTAAAQNATTGSAPLAVTVTLAAAATVSSGATAAAPLAVTTSLTATAVVNQNASATLTVTAAPSAGATRGVSAGAALAVTASLTSKVRTPVETWINTQPLYAAHRGGSADWVEHTMDAYDHAVAWNSSMALEVSVYQTLDGVWVASHDQATGRVFGTNYDIPTTNWATMSGLTTTTGGFPILRLDTLLTKYGSKRVIIVDDKGSQDISGGANSILTLLNANGGPAWYVAKSYYTSVAWAGGARSAGYYTLGYFYDVDIASIAANQSKFDVLMEEYNASPSSWSTILAYPQPVMAHIVATAGQKATGLANGAEGFMSSGVMEAVPQTGSDANLAVTATLTATASKATTGQASRTVTATLTATATRATSAGAPAVVTVTLTADATIGAIQVPVAGGAALGWSGTAATLEWSGRAGSTRRGTATDGA